MTQLPKQTIQDLFAGSAKSNGKATARTIILKNYPYAESMITDEEMKAFRAAKPVMPANLYPVAPVVIAAKPVSSGSKLARAKALYVAAADKSRAATIAMFIKELSMTKAGASSYFYMVQK